MGRVSDKDIRTVEQIHQEKEHDWRTRRVMRLIQARDQANQMACNLRVQFWSEVGCIAEDMTREEAERRRIEEDLEKKQRAREALKVSPLTV